MPLAAVLEPLLRGPGGHIVAAVLGAMFGSFANVCIVRWPPTDDHPHGRSIIKPGSHCPSCGHAVRWYDNIPIVSYLLLRGRCRDCGTSFSPRYLLVEAATGLLFLALYHLYVVVLAPWDPLPLRLSRFVIAAAFAFVMVVITFIDLDHKLILNKVTYPSIVAFYGLSLLLPDHSWWQGLVGAAVGYGVIRGVADGYHLLTGRRGLGYGDGKLLAVVGAYQGWQAVMVSLFLGSLIGSVISITYLSVARARARLGAAGDGEGGEGGGAGDDQVPSLRHTEIPFGPFLAAGALAVLFLEPWLRVSFSILYS